jgi:hypothetical protein
MRIFSSATLSRKQGIKSGIDRLLYATGYVMLHYSPILLRIDSRKHRFILVIDDEFRPAIPECLHGMLQFKLRVIVAPQLVGSTAPN